jgi:hypothetical protein
MVEDGCDRYLVSDVTCVLTRCTRKAGSGEGQRLHGFFMYFIQAIAEVVRGGLILGVTLGGKLQVSGCFEDSFTSFVCAKRFRQFVCSCVCVSSRLTTHDSRLTTHSSCNFTDFYTCNFRTRCHCCYSPTRPLTQLQTRKSSLIPLYSVAAWLVQLSFRLCSSCEQSRFMTGARGL